MGGLKWAYQDHWRVETPRGPVSQWVSIAQMDRFVKQVAAVGYTGLQIFDRNLPIATEMFGSLVDYEEFLRERGIQKIVDLWHNSTYDQRNCSPDVRATHQRIVDECRATMERIDGLAVENLVVMPGALYIDVEPVTDDKIKAAAELWSRVGEMTAKHGVKLAAHHEFFCAIRNADELEKFYEWSDPRYVFFFLDTAQHTIAGVDPVRLYERYHDRISGFHFKDTLLVDFDNDYLKPPDAELMAPTTARWFYEMGTGHGLVDFPALVHAMKRHGFSGWIGVEHDKANLLGGSSYAESTAVAAWYARHVLEPIYAGES